MQSVLLIFLQIATGILVAPLLTGWIKWVKCHCQNRTAPSLLQPYRNLIKLFHKETLLATQASWIFRFTPYFTLSIMMVISAGVPFLIVTPTHSILSDGIAIVGLMALSRFFIALSGLDIGTAFGGMGSSREMMIASLAEPALLLVLFILAMATSSTNLNFIFLYLSHSSVYLRPSFIFGGISLVMIILAETGRIPVDNPTTHLELTMTHEAMILEYTGRHLALIEWAAQLKLFIYAALLGNFIFPWSMATHFETKAIIIAICGLIIKLMTFGIVIGLIETSLAKMRLFKIPYFLGIAFSLALLGILSHIILES